MSDISLIVDTSSVAQAGKDILKLGEGVKSTAKSAQASASVFVNAISKIEKELLAVERSNKNYSRSLMETSKQHQQYINGLLGVERASRSASQAEKDFAAALRAEEAEISKARTEANKYNNELERLSNKYKPLYAASKQYERALEEINQAHRLGVINTQQHESAVDALGAEYAAFGNGTAGWSNQFVTGSDRAAKAANRFGVVTQQVGYQVGDFLVQVQGGQSVFVAFSQQATQLAGILPMMTGAFGMSQTALIGLSAALGIGIPLVTALGNVLFTTWKSSKDAGDGVGSLEERLKSARTEISQSEQAVRLLNSGFEDMALLTFKDNIEAAAKALAKLKDEKENARGGYLVDTTAAEKALKAAEDELAVAIERREEEKRLKGLQDDRIEAVSSFLDLMQARREDQLSETRELQNQVTEMERANELQAVSNRYGEDSLQYLQASLASRREALVEELALSNASAETKAQVLAAADEAARLAVEAYNADNALNGASNQAAQLARNLAAAASAIAAVTNATFSLNIDTIGLEVQNKLLSQGNDLITARAEAMKATKRAELADAFGSEDAAIREVAAQQLAEYSDALDKNTAATRINQDLTDKLNESTKKSTGSKKSSTKASQASKDAKKAEAAAQKELNALEKEGEALNDKYRTSVEKYGKEVEKLEDHLKAGRITTDTYTRAMEDLQKTLTDSKPLVGDLIDAFAEFASQGFKDFEGFVDKVKSLFTNLIKDMIATALRNKILIPIQTAASGGSGVGSALSGVSGAISGGSGTLGLLGATGAAFGQGATASLSAFASGGLSGGMGFVGTALSQATASLPAFGAALGAAVPVIGAVALAVTAFKTKTKELDAGIKLNIEGNDLLAKSYRDLEKSRFFGLSKSRSTTESSINSGPFQAAYNTIYEGIEGLVNTFNIGTKSVTGYSKALKISVQGMDEAEAKQEVLNKLQEVQNDLAQRALGRLGGEGVDSRALFQREGETSSDTLARLSASLTTANDALFLLDKNLLPLGKNGVLAAVALTDMAGGIEQFASATASYYNDFYTAEEKLAKTREQLNSAAREMGVKGYIPTLPENFRKRVDELFRLGETEQAAALMVLSPMVTTMASLRNEIASVGDTASTTAQELREQKLAAKELGKSQRQDLYQQILELTGQTEKLRRMELAALEPNARANQKRVWALQDEAAAAEEASSRLKAISDERLGLEKQILTLQGNTLELRKLELAALDPSNRSLQNYIYKLEDAQVAADKAAQAEEERVAKQQAVLDERKGLEERLLTLQGNTAELRRRELAALDPTNRALQLTIYKLEDMQTALENLDPTKFTTRFEYEMAQARQRITGISPSSTFSGSSASSTAPVAVVQSDPETIKELKVLRTTVEDLLIKIEDNTGREYGVIREWNRTGLPKERV